MAQIGVRFRFSVSSELVLPVVAGYGFGLHCMHGHWKSSPNRATILCDGWHNSHKYANGERRRRAKHVPQNIGGVWWD